MRQFFKRPIRQIKVVVATATPPLATHSAILQFVNAGAGVSDFNSYDGALIPAVGEAPAILLNRVPCKALDPGLRVFGV